MAQCEGCLTPYDCDVTHPAPCRTTPDALLRRVHERVHTVRIYAHAEWFDKDGDEHPGAVEVSWDHYKGDADWTERKASAPTLAAALQAVLDAEEVPR